jgi:hypothetical protein
VTTKKPLPPGLHLIPGESAGDIFMRVFINGRAQALIDTDALSHGPTPARDTLENWRHMRERYWMNLAQGERTTQLFHNPMLDDVHRFRSAPAITIWAATGLDELLFIAHCLHLADANVVDPARLRLVQFEAMPLDRSRLLSLGFLNEAAMSAHPDPREFTPEELDDYRGLWSALTSRDAQAFENYPKQFPDAHAWLHQAARLMLRRFPDATSGLPYWDRLLLEVARQRAPNVLRTIADTMTKDWSDPDLVGDWVLYGRIMRMADKRLPRPLLNLRDPGLGMRDATLELTAFGTKVLEGRASNLPTNPIDDWAGGVRLLSEQGRVWFQDRGRVRQRTNGDKTPGEWGISR